MKSVSVVICTHNKKERLALTLRGYEKIFQRFPMDHEVIICNDGGESVGDYLAWLDYDLDLKIIETAHIGRSNARNMGAQAASGDIIVFNDDDIIADPTCFSFRMNLHEIVPNAVVLGKYKQVYLTETEIANQNKVPLEIDMLKAISHEDIHEMCTKNCIFKTKRVSNHWICGTTGNFSLSKSVFLESGGFDLGFHGWGYEDIEYAYRLSKMGCVFFCNIDNSNYHIDHYRNKQHMRDEMEKNIHYFYEKHNKPLEIALYWEFLIGKITLGEFDSNTIKELNNEFYDIKYPGLQRYCFRSIRGM